MGCGRTLAQSVSGRIFCVNRQCPDELAAWKLLERDAAEHEHILTVKHDEWVLRHPLYERIAPRGLEACEYNRLADDLVRGYDEGRYRMIRESGGCAEAYLEKIVE